MPNPAVAKDGHKVEFPVRANNVDSIEIPGKQTSHCFARQLRVVGTQEWRGRNIREKKKKTEPGQQKAGAGRSNSNSNWKREKAIGTYNREQSRRRGGGRGWEKGCQEEMAAHAR